jgi:L-arabinose isomerase
MGEKVYEILGKGAEGGFYGAYLVNGEEWHIDMILLSHMGEGVAPVAQGAKEAVDQDHRRTSDIATMGIAVILATNYGP